MSPILTGRNRHWLPIGGLNGRAKHLHQDLPQHRGIGQYVCSVLSRPQRDLNSTAFSERRHQFERHPKAFQ